MRKVAKKYHILFHWMLPWYSRLVLARHLSFDNLKSLNRHFHELSIFNILQKKISYICMYWFSIVHVPSQNWVIPLLVSFITCSPPTLEDRALSWCISLVIITMQIKIRHWLLVSTYNDHQRILQCDWMRTQFSRYKESLCNNDKKTLLLHNLSIWIIFMLPHYPQAN